MTFLDEIVASSREMITLYIILTLLMALAAFIGSVQMARYVTKPLSRLELAVNEVEQGNLDANFAIRGTLETEKIRRLPLSSMISNVKQLMEQIMADQEMIRTSELKALQSQINPHFLYNTLDSIVWIAEETGSEKIKEITVALANYFRIVLSSGKDIISVRDEIEHVRSYLVIQKMRYETLDYKIEVSGDALALTMPKLILQPIVENAIYHGVKNNPDGGTIWVRGFVDGGKACFVIDDNGRGCGRMSCGACSSRCGRAPSATAAWPCAISASGSSFITARNTELRWKANTGRGPALQSRFPRGKGRTRMAKRRFTSSYR